jgi:hypothetical protein
MTVSSVKTGDLGISFALNNNYMEPIATTLVDSGGSSNITFNDIPQTYKHLQIRLMSRNNRASTSDTLGIQFNGDTSISNYVWLHYVYGNNGSAGAAGYGTGVNASIYLGECPSSTATSNIFGVSIADILDYTSESKNKVLRSLNGKEADALNQGFISLSSGAWLSTAPITSIKIFANNGNFVQYSRFSLYGIKG